jgi:hypothetical protein
MKRKQKIDSKLSKEKIIDMAIKISDELGLNALSMRKLAASLDVEAMSLYYHFENKRELIHDMTDSVVPTIPPLSSCQDWKDALCKRATIMRETLLSHPWVTHEFVAGMNIGPRMLSYVDTTIGYFVSAGFSYKLADYAWHTIDSYIYGFNLQVQNFPLQPEEYIPAAKQFLPMIPPETHPHMHGMSLSIINGTHDGIQDFNFGLELIVESLDRLLVTKNKE